ncbi:MAG: alpha/beta hydrolase-fold protein [Bacteroidetes bacterium]|nr:alpha/beta hydrolase-fold protein [Bacteroidota bacterium]
MKTLLCFSLCFASTLLFACAPSRLNIRVIVPPDTPPGSQIFIAGNSPLLGDWNPGRIPMQRRSESVWEFTLELAHGDVVEFKITRGSWNSQAIYQNGIIPSNHVLTMRGDTLLELRPISWSDQAVTPGGGITGRVEYHRDLSGEGLAYARDVIVWLPPDYNDQPSRRFPVLYMHDGQNVFDPSTSFIGYDWHADEVADSLIRAEAIEPVIIVGITNSPDRIPEYSDTDKGRAYGRFVVERLKPLIDSTYRTLPGREHTAVMGSSMGGLISFLFLRWHPDVFSKAGCLSSVFDRRASSLLNAVAEDHGPKHDLRVYMDCGGVGGEASLKPGMDRMYELLVEQGYADGTEVVKFYDAAAEHNERAWAARLWRPMVFLFGKDGH